MGEVYLAHDTRLNRGVAVKVLPAAFAENAERRQRFEQEARATATLNHPNVMAVFDVGVDDGVPYVVLELLEGQTLAAALSKGALPPRTATDLAGQIAQGLAAAHAKGIVHRDLKPDNIFVTADGRAKILDFGLAKLIEDPDQNATVTHLGTTPPTGPGFVLGTAGYMAPEQVRGEAADHRADIFAFGAVFYEMLSGRPAFGGDSSVERMTAILKDDPPALLAGAVPAASRSCRPSLPREEPVAAVSVRQGHRVRAGGDVGVDLGIGLDLGGRCRTSWRREAVVAAARAGRRRPGRCRHRRGGDATGRAGDDPAS